MNKLAITAVAAVILATGIQQYASAHCEVPCGIYGDQLRFEGMLEDQRTVKKAMAEITKLAANADALSANQLARWVANKELHASKIQTTIAQYFMHQRIKPMKKNYVDQITSAHAVMLAAMKCKQSVNSTDADTLEKAIKTFHTHYEAK